MKKKFNLKSICKNNIKNYINQLNIYKKKENNYKIKIHKDLYTILVYKNYTLHYVNPVIM